MIVELIGYDIEEHYGPSYGDQPNYLYTIRSKKEDPMKSGWGVNRDATDSRVVIEVWRMMKVQDEALKDSE